jgi:hypothetical protein
MGVRLPTILGKAIEDTVQTLNTLSDEAEIIDLAACIRRMGGLMIDLRLVAFTAAYFTDAHCGFSSENRKLRPIVDDGEGDVTLWNKEIAKFFQGNAIFLSFNYACSSEYKEMTS